MKKIYAVIISLSLFSLLLRAADGPHKLYDGDPVAYLIKLAEADKKDQQSPQYINEDTPDSLRPLILFTLEDPSYTNLSDEELLEFLKTYEKASKQMKFLSELKKIRGAKKRNIILQLVAQDKCKTMAYILASQNYRYSINWEKADKDENTFFHFIARNKSATMLKVFGSLALYNYAHKKNTDEESPFLIAARVGFKEFFQTPDAFISRGEKISAPLALRLNKQGYKLLHILAQHGYDEILKDIFLIYKLSHCQCIHIDEEGNNFLHTAYAFGQEKVITLILEHFPALADRTNYKHVAPKDMLFNTEK